MGSHGFSWVLMGSQWVLMGSQWVLSGYSDCAFFGFSGGFQTGTPPLGSASVYATGVRPQLRRFSGMA